MSDESSFFRQKPQDAVPTGQSQEAVDASPSELSGGFQQQAQAPVWKSFVDNQDYQDANRGAIQAEQQQMRQAASAASSGDIFKGVNGKLIHKARGQRPVEYDAADWTDDPIAGPEARKSMWDREIRTSRQEAETNSLELANPAFHAQELKQKDREAIEAEGSMLQETDPRHVELKSKLVADDDYKARKADMAQRAWNAKVRASQLEAMDPEEWWMNRQAQPAPTPTEQRQATVQTAQSTTAQGQAADQQAAARMQEINTKLQGGVNAEESKSLLAERAEIAANRARIADINAGAAGQIEGVKAESANATPPKDFFDLGDTVSGIWDAVKGLGTSAPAAFYQLVEGMERPDQYSDSAKKAFAEADAFNKEMQAKTEANQKAGTSSSVGESFREAGGSLGFSLGSMAAAIPASLAGGVAGAKIGAAAGLGAGAAVGAVAGGVGAAPGAAVGATIGGISTGTIGAVTAGMAASGTAAYRMAGASFLNESWQQLQAESQKKSGRPMNEAEMKSAYDALLPIAQNSALWEAGPEAVGNAVTMGAGKIIFGLGKGIQNAFLKNLAKTAGGKVAVKVGAGAGSLATELTGETLTNVEQSADQQKATAIAQGQDPNAIKADWSAGGVVESFKQVAPQTLALMGLMGGAGGALKIASKVTGIGDYKKDNARAGEALNAVNTGLAAIDPTATPATVDEMHTASFIARPTDGPAEMADAVMVERELKALGEQEAQGRADNLAGIQAELDNAIASGAKAPAIKAIQTKLDAASAEAPSSIAHLTRAALQIAAGKDLTSLSPEELAAVGYESKDGKPKKDANGNEVTPKTYSPIKPAKGATAASPMITRGADGSIILTDTALDMVAAASPRARARITMKATEAIEKANVRAEAARQASLAAPAASGQAGAGVPAGSSAPVLPNTFDVPMRDGSMMRVQAKDANDALREAAAVGQIAGTPAVAVAAPPSAGASNGTQGNPAAGSPAGVGGSAPSETGASAEGLPVTPRPTKRGDERDAWDDQYGDMRKGGRSHNDDGTVYQRTAFDETAPKVFSALRGKNLNERVDAIGVGGDAEAGTAIKQLTEDGWVWDEAAGKMVNPANPSEKPIDGLQRIRSEKGKPSPAVAKARAIVAKAKKNKSLAARLIEGTNRAETSPGGIVVNPEQIIGEAIDSGMTEKQAVQYFTRVLDEEIRHLAQYDAAAILFKMAGGKGDFMAWTEAHYAAIWAADFAGTTKEATVRDLYLRAADGDAATVQAKWDAMTNGNKTLEAIRMMSQGKNVTEQAKLWANISTELKNALRAALAALKKFADTASPEILQEIKNLENALSQLTGTPNASSSDARNNPEKQNRSGPNAGTPKAAEAASNSQPASPSGTQPGGLETPASSAWVGKRIAFVRNGERLEGEVSYAEETWRGPLLRVKLDTPDASGTPTRAIFLDQMLDATGATITGFENLSPAPEDNATSTEPISPDDIPFSIGRATSKQDADYLAAAMTFKELQNEFFNMAAEGWRKDMPFRQEADEMLGRKVTDAEWEILDQEFFDGSEEYDKITNPAPVGPPRDWSGETFADDAPLPLGIHTVDGVRFEWKEDESGYRSINAVDPGFFPVTTSGYRSVMSGFNKDAKFTINDYRKLAKDGEKVVKEQFALEKKNILKALKSKGMGWELSGLRQKFDSKNHDAEISRWPEKLRVEMVALTKQLLDAIASKDVVVEDPTNNDALKNVAAELKNAFDAFMGKPAAPAAATGQSYDPRLETNSGQDTPNASGNNFKILRDESGVDVMPYEMTPDQLVTYLRKADELGMLRVTRGYVRSWEHEIKGKLKTAWVKWQKENPQDNAEPTTEVENADKSDSFSVTPFESASDGMNSVENREEAERLFSEGKKLFAVSEMDEEAVEIESLDELQGYTADQIFWQDTGNAESATTQPSVEEHANGMILTEGNTFYADTKAMGQIQNIPRLKHDHIGMGEFETTTPFGKVEWARWPEKTVPGMSGRVHKLMGPIDAVTYLVEALKAEGTFESNPEKAPAVAEPAAPAAKKRKSNPLTDKLRDIVTGKIERGEGVAIEGIPAATVDPALEAARAKARAVLDGLFAGPLPSNRNALRAAQLPKGFTQEIPAERFMPLMEAASAMVQAGVNTPEALAAEMDNLAPERKAVPFVQAFWFALKAAGAKGKAEPKWADIYSKIDKAAEQAQISSDDSLDGRGSGTSNSDTGSEGLVGDRDQGADQSGVQPSTEAENDSGGSGGGRAGLQPGQPAVGGSGDSVGGSSGQSDGSTADQPDSNGAAGTDSGVGSPDDGNGRADAPRPDAVKRVRPEAGSPEANFVITDDFNMPASGKARIAANIKAIELLREIEKAGRNATEEEKTILSAYSGWGSFKEAFNDIKQAKWVDLQNDIEAVGEGWQANNIRRRKEYQELEAWRNNWGKLHDRVSELLEPDEFRAMSKSVLNAHYTALPVIDGMWKLLKRLGFKGGPLLENSAGGGYFIGRQPGDLADVTDWSAIELDEITSRVLAKLYPEARVNGTAPAENRQVAGQGFQDSKIPNNSILGVIGNFPFAADGPGESKSEFGQVLNLHNYFFARSLSKLQPGGIIVAITSASTMDNQLLQRELLATNTELVGAIRLPNSAFKDSAGTEVTTDIIVLRKNDGSRDTEGAKWLNTVQIGEDVVTSKPGKDHYSVHDWLSSIPAEWVPVNEELREPFKAWRVQRPVGGEKWKAMNEVLNEVAGRDDNGKATLQFTAPVTVNEYFLDHPEMALGRHSLQGSMYSADEYALTATEGDLIEKLNAAIETFPENIIGANVAAELASRTREADQGDRDGSTVIRNGKVFDVVDGQLQPVQWETELLEKSLDNALKGDEDLAEFRRLSEEGDMAELRTWIDGKLASMSGTERAKIETKTAAALAKRHAAFKAWAPIRDAAKKIVDSELSGATDEALATLRTELNTAYDAYVKEFGAIGKRGHTNAIRFLDDDIDTPLVESLEDEEMIGTTDTGKPIYQYVKRPIFTGRILPKIEAPSKAESVPDAIAISMGYMGRLSVPYMAQLLDKTENEVTRDLNASGLAMVNPTTGLFEISELYLSGEVRTKLQEAEKANVESGGQYQANVDALKAIMPAPRPISGISITMGARWIPNTVYTAFVNDVLKLPFAAVEYQPNANIWKIANGGTERGKKHTSTDAANEDSFETPHFTALEILDAVLNSKKLEVWDSPRGAPSVLNTTQTLIAQAKANEMQGKFIQWLRSSEKTVEVDGRPLQVGRAAEDSFNEKVNGVVPPSFTGDWVTLPGQSGEIYLLKHRLAVLARMITTGYGMMAHGVGSGKTYNLIALAMELKRLGKARKSMTIVQGSTIRQFAASHMKAYPQAKILVADAKNFSARKRARFLARVATGDYDSIILTHSAVGNIGHSPQSIKNYMAKQFAELDEALKNAESGSDNMRDIQKVRDKLQERMDKMLASAAKNSDKILTWEQLGIDAILVDEAHTFKNIPIITRKDRVKNMPTGSSDRAIMMQIKCAAVQRVTGGKNVFFATGTPITNTMAEAYAMLNFVAPEVLANRHIKNFDDFISTFCRTVSEPEATWKGEIENVERLAKFINGPELINIVRSVFDVALGNENLGLRVPKMKGGVPKMVMIEPTESSEIFNDWVIDTAAEFKAIPDKRNAFKEDPWMQAIPIMVMQAGMAQAIDPRLINPQAPDDPNSKVNKAVADIHRIWLEGKERRTAQVVFSDLNNPFSTYLLRRFNGDPFEEFGTDGAEIEAIEEQIFNLNKVKDKTPAVTKLIKKLGKDLEKLRGKQFSVFADIKEKLVKLGVPAKEIAIAADMSKEALEKSFDKVNSGEIRIIMGSTEKLGVGVNIQERLAAAHNISPPRDFKPAMMEQRIGRIIRQGNLFRDWADQAYLDVVEKYAGRKLDGKDLAARFKAAEKWVEENGDMTAEGSTVREMAEAAADEFSVEVLNYGLKLSMDSAVYSMMKAKQGFIEQILMGIDVMDEFDDPASAEGLGYAMMAAEAMGNEDLKRRVMIMAELQKLDAARNADFADKNRRQEALQSAETSLRYAMANSPEAIRELGAEFEGIYDSVSRVVKTTKGQLAKEAGTEISEEEAKQPAERTVNAPVFEFGGEVLDTGDPKVKTTEPINKWIDSLYLRALQNVGEVIKDTFTVNGKQFTVSARCWKKNDSLADARFEVYIPKQLPGNMWIDKSFTAGLNPSISLKNAIQEIARPGSANAVADHIERVRANRTADIARLKEAVANEKPFEREKEYWDLKTEQTAVDRRIAIANANPRNHRFYRSLFRAVGAEQADQFFNLDGATGTPKLAADVWNRLHIRLRLTRRGVARTPAAIQNYMADRLRADVKDAASQAGGAEMLPDDFGSVGEMEKRATYDPELFGTLMDDTKRSPKAIQLARQLEGLRKALATYDEKYPGGESAGNENLRDRDNVVPFRARLSDKIDIIEEELRGLEKRRAKQTDREGIPFGYTSMPSGVLQAGPLPRPILTDSPEWMAMGKDERLATVKRQKSVARQYVEAIKSLFNEDLGTDDGLKDVPEINSNPVQVIREIQHLVEITINGMEPLRAGPLLASQAWSTPQQRVSSKATSISYPDPANKSPIVFTAFKAGKISIGPINADIGGGRFDQITNWLKTRGVTNVVWDRFNRSDEFNNASKKRLQGGKADTATASNVLNVIPEKESRIATIATAFDSIKIGGTAAFSMYEAPQGGDKGKDSYQHSKKTAEYIPEIEEVFGKGNVKRIGEILVATKNSPLQAGPLPAPATDFKRFPAEWNSLNVPRAEMPQVPTSERPAFLQFLKDAGVRVTDEQMAPKAITPIQIEYFPAKVERAKGIPAERRVFVSSDDYLLDGHHQWMAQRDRGAVNVTRIGLPVREAIATMFLFPGTEKREGGQALNAGPLPAPDPRLVKEFGENFEADEYGMPVSPKTLPDGHPLLEVTWPSGENKKFRKKIATMPADHVLVKGLDPSDKRAKGLPADHPAIRGGWLPAGDVSRRDFARAVVNFFLSFGTELPADAQGVAFATGGGGGAGKSSILERLQKEGALDATGTVLVNADDIKEMIPEFELIKGHGDGRAAAIVHEESSHIAQLLQDALLKPGNPRFNFIFDGTLANKDKSITKMNQWKAAGYTVHLVGVTVEPYEAMIRAVLRGKDSGRWVPTSELAKAHLSFNRNLPELMDAADRVNLFDNTPPEAHEVAKKTDGEDTISIVNQEYFEKIKLREDESSTKPPSQSQAVYSRGDGQDSGRSEESGRGIDGESQGRGGSLQGEKSLTSSGLTRLMRGDQGNDTIEPTGQEEWAKRNPASAAKLRAAVDRQARAKGYTPEKVFHATASTEKTEGKYPYAPGDLRYTGTKPEDWDEVVINGRGAFYVTNDKEAASQFGWLKTRYKSLKRRTLELYAKQGNYFDSSNPDHMESVKRSVTREELKASNDFWDDFHKKNPDGGYTNKNTSPPQWGQFWKKDIVGWQVMEDPRVIAKLKEAGFDGYRSREMSPDEDNEIDFISLGVFNPSSVKSADLVTFDKDGNPIPISERFDDSKDSILRAGTLPTPEPSPVFRYAVPVNPALVEEAKGEREGFGRNVASGKLAGFGSDRTRAEQDAIDAVYEFTRTVQKNADTMKVAREMLARDPQDIERKLLDSVTDKDFNLTPADHLAIQLLIDRKTQEAGNDPAKLAENGARMMAYRIMRGDAGRLLQIGYDRFLTPAERNLAAITDAIFSPTRKIQKVIASKPIAQRSAFIRAAAEARVKTVEAELAKAGLSIAEITRKSDKLALENSQMMKEVMKLRKTLDQNILKMIQHGATKADIKRRYGAEAAEQAQQVLTDARADLKAKIAPMVQAGMTMEQIVAKLGALQAGPINNAASPLSPDAIAAEIERILAEGFGMPAMLAEKPALPRPKAKPAPVVPVPKGSTPVPTAPTAINADWSRPIINAALDTYTFDTKDRSGIMTRVENIRMLAGAVGKIDQLDPAKKAQALAHLAEIDKTLGKYGTDTNKLLAEVHAGKHIEDFRFNINDVQHVAHVARIISTMDADWIDKASEVLYANMLSGLQTMVVNATAIVPAAWEATVGRGFEMAINAALAPAGLADPLSPQWGETKYILKALGPAWTRAVSNFAASMQAQHPMFDRDVLNQQPDIERVMGGKGYRMGGSISGKKGDIIRIPSRLLMATDDFNMTLFTMADVGAYAFRFVKAQGFKPGTPQFDKEMRIQINTPGSESYILAATRYKRAIFSNPLPGEKDPVTGKTVPVHGLGDIVGEWAGKLNGALTKEHDSMFIKLVQTLAKISFFPFQRVPFNILRKGIRYTPNPVSLFDIGLGIVQNSRTTGPNGETVWEWNANNRNAELIERLGMQLQGAALLTLLVAVGAGEGDDDDLKKPFLITGSMPFTPQGRAQRDAQTRSGLGPSRFSFRGKDGTERFGFNYGRLEPLATTLAATIDTLRAVKRAHRAGKDNYDAAAEALGGLVAQAKDKSFLRGVSDLMALVTNTMAEPDLRENRKFQQYLAGRVAMVVPNIIKQPLREMDNLYRERSNDFMQEVLYQVAPIGQKSAKVDPWGEQAEKTGFAATRIFDVTDAGTDKPHPVDQMLLRWRDSGKWSKAPDEADRKPWFPNPIANSTFKNPSTGQTVKMNEAQLAEFREKAGKATAAKLKALSLNYESPTATDIEKVKKTVTESRAAIKAALAFKFSKTTK